MSETISTDDTDTDLQRAGEWDGPTPPNMEPDYRTKTEHECPKCGHQLTLLIEREGREDKTRGARRELSISELTRINERMPTRYRFRFGFGCTGCGEADKWCNTKKAEEDWTAGGEYIADRAEPQTGTWAAGDL